jgi:hypothetical protein
MKTLKICIACLFFMSCNSDKKIFKFLDSSETGIDFENTIFDSADFNSMTFEYIYNGAGLAVGDFNNDGKTDLYFAGNQVSSKMYLNKGGLNFKEITSESNTGTKAWCTGVTVTDVNQDGWQDIYVCVAGFVKDSTKRANLLFENQGLNKNGIPFFKEKATEYGLNDMGYSTQAAFFDYDRDGDLDCYILTNALEKENRNTLRPKRVNGEAPSNDRLYRNEGNCKFKNITHKAGILTEGYGLGLVISDINGDGWDDVYCSNDFLSNDLIWVNNQDGTFTNKAGEYLKHQSYNGMGVDIADINNDANPEIMVVDMLPETNERQKMMLAGSNHDRLQLDLKLGYQPQFMRNTLQLNRKKELSNDLGEKSKFDYSNNYPAVFSEISQFSGVDKTDWSWAPLFGDFDNDGFNDLLITNGYRRDVTNMDFTAYLASQRDLQMFDNKVKDHLKVFEKIKELPEIKLPNYAFHNNGDLTFTNVSKKWGIDEPSYSNGAIYADFDNDGDLDYVVNNIDSKAFFYENLTNNSEKHPNWICIKFEGLDGNKDAIGAKVAVFSDDKVFFKENQPTRGYVSSVENFLHFGLGVNKKIDSVVVFWPNGKKQSENLINTNQSIKIRYNDKKSIPFFTIHKENIDKQYLEISPESVGLKFRHQEKDFNDFNQNPLLPYKYSRISPSLTSGDINNDNLDDFIIGTDVGQSDLIFTQNENGSFSQTSLEESEKYETVSSVLFDTDSDGDLDFYAVSGGSHSEGASQSYQDRLYINDGSGKFSLKRNGLPTTYFPGSTVSISDFDKDGDLDIFRGSRLISGKFPFSPPSFLFENQTIKGKVKFVDKTHQFAPELSKVGLITSSVWFDANKDNLPDLVLIGEWMSPMILINNKNKFSPPKNLVEKINGLWQTLYSIDVDHDGDLDLMLGNIGQNSKYHASKERPLKIYAKDYDSNGRIDPVMSFYLGNNEVPVPTRDLITLQVPGLKRYFPLYSDYAKAKMKDILDKKDLESALQVNVEELRSGWLENLGKLNFVFHPFPAEAQFSLVNSFIYSDNYLFLFGNSKAPETVGGWWDASIGSVLNFENGEFKKINNGGLIADNEAKSAIIVKRRRDKILIIGNINSNLQIFKFLNFK